MLDKSKSFSLIAQTSSFENSQTFGKSSWIETSVNILDALGYCPHKTFKGDMLCDVYGHAVIQEFWFQTS